MTAGEVRARAEHARDSLLTAQLRYEPGGPMASNNTTGLERRTRRYRSVRRYLRLQTRILLQRSRSQQAIGLLPQAIPEKKIAARDLGWPLEAKTLTSYGTSHITEAKAKELLKYASRLVEEMDFVLAS